jgi:hypothetical protein
MNVHNEVPVLILHVLEADIPKDASVVDQNVDASEVLDSGLNDLLAICYAVVVGYGFTAGSFYLIDDNIGSLWLELAMLALEFEGPDMVICRQWP